LVDQYLPGGHLLTVNDWRRAKQVSDWYQTANNIYWLVSAVFSPINTGIRYSASKLGMSRPLQLLQQNLFTWFYTAYVHRLGSYLIAELNTCLICCQRSGFTVIPNLSVADEKGRH